MTHSEPQVAPIVPEILREELDNMTEEGTLEYSDGDTPLCTLAHDVHDYRDMVLELRDLFSVATFGVLESEEQADPYARDNGEIFAAHDGSHVQTEQDLDGYANLVE